MQFFWSFRLFVIQAPCWGVRTLSHRVVPYLRPSRGKNSLLEGMSNVTYSYVYPRCMIVTDLESDRDVWVILTRYWSGWVEAEGKKRGTNQNQRLLLWRHQHRWIWLLSQCPVWLVRSGMTGFVAVCWRVLYFGWPKIDFGWWLRYSVVASRLLFHWASEIEKKGESCNIRDWLELSCWEIKSGQQRQ